MSETKQPKPEKLIHAVALKTITTSKGGKVAKGAECHLSEADFAHFGEHKAVAKYVAPKKEK
jgi:hypothetical protein